MSVIDIYQCKKQQSSSSSLFHIDNFTVSPGVDWELRVKNAGRNTKLFQEEFEPVAPFDCSDKHQRLALHQAQLQQCVDEKELVFFLTFDAVLLQLAAVWKLRALQLEDYLNEHRAKWSSVKLKPNNSQYIKVVNTDATLEQGNTSDRKVITIQSWNIRPQTVSVRVM